MKIIICPLVILFNSILFSCNSNNNHSTDQLQRIDTVYIHDTVFIDKENNEVQYWLGPDWQDNFGLTHNPKKDSIWGKPVSYYLEQEECSAMAFDFYHGYLRPTDNGSTSELLKLAYSDNDKLRPFYRWILNMTIEIQDGALGEYTGVPARRYATTYPIEFFEYMDIDPSGQKYRNWFNSILYSGFFDMDDYNNPKSIRPRLIKTMKSNCIGCDENMKKRIEQFALDCFPDKRE